MKGFSKATMIIAKIAEVCHWVGAGVLSVLLVCCLFFKEQAPRMIAGDPRGEDAIYGFHFTLTAADGSLSLPALTVFAIAGILLFALMAMVFRNIYLIIKTSRGETSFSQGATPFQPDNVRMLKEIGIFAIAVPIVGLIMSVVGRLAVGPEFAETSVDLSWILVGLVILWLTQVFAYGAELQGDADGLI